jgi:hypothetical protein
MVPRRKNPSCLVGNRSIAAAATHTSTSAMFVPMRTAIVEWPTQRGEIARKLLQEPADEADCLFRRRPFERRRNLTIAAGHLLAKVDEHGGHHDQHQHELTEEISQ